MSTRSAQIARHVADGSVVLVGEQRHPDHLRPLRDLPNVHWSGRVSRGEVAAIVSDSDACVLPHRRTALTEAMSPLKLYEYLAAGRPVVASDLPPVRDVDPHVVIPAAGRFVDGVTHALRPRTHGRDGAPRFIERERVGEPARDDPRARAPMSSRLPDFLVMGVPKSGTTSFHHYLRRHPGIFLPEKKEVHYFSSDALQRSVAGPGDHERRGECVPVARRVHRALPVRRALTS